MTPSDIIETAKIQTGSVGTIDDKQAYQYFNQFHKELAYELMNADNNYNKTYWTTSLVAGQNEYTLQPATPGATNIEDRYGQLKIEDVYIKYKEDEEYTKMGYTDYDNLERTTDYYRDKQNQNEPFFMIASNSIFIYPKPETDIIEGLKMWGSRKLYDLDSSSTEDEIVLPEELKEVLQLGLQYKFLGHRGADYRDQYLSMKQEYKREKRTTINLLKHRLTSPVKAGRMKNLSELE